MAERGRYDRASVFGILDDGFLCHLGFASSAQAIVVPTVYGRVDEIIYLHGAPANHALRRAAQNERVCLTVSLVDGLVLARSAFHHAVNYRSVMAFGVASEVSGLAEKRRGALAIVDHLLPGRTDDVRPPTDAELRATRVIRFEITEASAKVRSGGPRESPEDLRLENIWAGEIPLKMELGVPVVDDQGPVHARLPGCVSAFAQRGVP